MHSNLRLRTFLIASMLIVFSVPASFAADGAPVYDATELNVYYRDWLLLGPFPNSPTQDLVDFRHDERCTGFFRDWLESTGGEAAADPKPGDTVTVDDPKLKHTWSLVESDTDKVHLNDRYQPNDNIVAYAYCIIDSPSEQRVVASVGSNDCMRLWVNGELVHNFFIRDGRWLAVDDDYVPIALKKGKNRILFKVNEGTGNFGLAFRLLDYDKTVDEVSTSIETHRKLSVVTNDDELSILFGTPHRIEVLAPGKPVNLEIIHPEQGVTDSFAIQPGFRKTIPLENAPEGHFKVRATLELDSGQTVVSERDHFRGRLPRHKLPERLGTDLAMRDADGKPYFPIGTYGAPVDHYKQLREAGYTFVMGGASSLDAAHEAGLMVGVGLHGGGEDWLEHIREIITENRDHPAVMFWMMFDEPGYNRADLPLMHEAYKLIHELDPVHPAYLVITDPSVYETFGRCCDVLSVDTYPVSQGDYASVGTNIEKAVADSDGDQAVWQCGQLFAWPGDRLPTPQEHRMMSYLSIQAGAKAMLWYSFTCYTSNAKYTPGADPVLWASHLKMLKEFKELEPVLVYPGLGEKLDTGHHAVRATAKRGPNGSYTVFVINTSRTETATMSVQTPSRYTGRLRVLFEDRNVKVTDGIIQETLEPLAVHIYRLNG